MARTRKDPVAEQLQWFSAESFWGWRGHLKRVVRLYAKLREDYSYPEEYEQVVDDYVVFFVFCFSLKDWLVAEDILSYAKLTDRMNTLEAMRICRDIANRTKHRRISSVSYDEHWRILGYPKPVGPAKLSELYIMVANRDETKRRALGVATECVDFWERVAAEVTADRGAGMSA